MRMCVCVCVYLWWLHVEYFSDPALHDEEVRVVDVQLHRAKQVLDTRGRGITPIDQVLVPPTNYNLEHQ